MLAITTIVSLVLNDDKVVNGVRINDPLWDGNDCPAEDSCCYISGMP